MLRTDQRQINLYIVNNSDDTAIGSMARMTELARGSAVDPFVWIAADEHGSLSTATVVGESSSQQELTEILSEVKILDRIRLVSLLCSNTDSDDGASLSQAVHEARIQLQQVKAARTSIIDVRVQGIEAETFTPARQLFSSEAVANVILIPHDRTSDSSSARLVTADRHDRFESHIAVELASLLAGWVTVDASPVDDWKPSSAGSGDPNVFFVRSLVRSLVCPPLPINEIVSEDRPLPVPDGFFASSQQAATVRVVAQKTFPEELIYVPSTPPDTRVEIGVAQASKEIPLRLFTIIKSLPKIFRDGISRDLESLQGDGLQDFIGRDAWLSIAFRDRQGNTTPHPWEDRLDEAIIELEELDDMPVLAQLPDEVWERLMTRPFGVADGSGESSDALEQTGEGRFLVTDPYALTVEMTDTAESAIERMLDAVDGTSTTSFTHSSAWASPSLDTSSDSPKAEDQIESDPESIDETSDPAEDKTEENPESSTETSDLEEHDPTSGSLDTEDTRLKPESARMALAKQSKSEVPEGGLLGALTAEFLRQRDAAERRVKEMISAIRSLAEESRQDNKTKNVPPLSQLLLGGSLIAVIYSVCVLTGVARVTDLDWLGGNVRVALWVICAATIFCQAIAVKWTPINEARGDIPVFVITMAIAVWLAFLDPLRYSDAVLDNVGARFWPYWPTTVTVVLIGLYTRASTKRMVGTWRWSLARFLGWGTAVFATATAIVGSSSAYSLIQPISRFPADSTSRIVHWTDEERRRSLIVVLVLSVIAAIVGLLIIGVIWVRIEYRNRARGVRFRFAVDEARAASRTHRRLQLVTTQWLGTAAAMSRVMWRPLGSVNPATSGNEPTYTSDETLLKFQAATLELTPRGDELLLARLRALVVKPGWLTNQYRRAAESFIAAEPTVIASDLQREDWPTPQTCESAPRFEEVLGGTAEGRRWSFMRSLYDGVLDSALQEAVSDYSPAEVFSSVLGAPQAANTRSHVEGESADPFEFFGSLLPEGEQELPSGLVSVAFAADDERRTLTSHVSWPQELIPMELDNCVPIKHGNSFGLGGAVITAVRCDISPPFEMTAVGNRETSAFTESVGFIDPESDAM